MIPLLWTAQQLTDSPDAPPILRDILDWTKTYMTNTHPSLGRPGPVCPFVAPALKTQSIWFALASDIKADLEQICNALNEYMEAYQKLPFAGQSAKELRSLIVVFPSLISHSESSFLMQAAHAAMKPRVVEAGLMLGEFYPNSDAPGLHNPAFRPLRSPIPLFVYRELVPNDLIFLTRPEDSLARRLQFVRSYLKILQPRLSLDLLNRALETENALKDEFEKLSHPELRPRIQISESSIN